MAQMDLFKQGSSQIALSECAIPSGIKFKTRIISSVSSSTLANYIYSAISKECAEPCVGMKFFFWGGEGVRQN